MRITRKALLLLRAQNLLSVVLLLTALAMAGWLSLRYSWQWDWTVNQRNTLSAASEELLAALPGPIEITAFARERSGIRERLRAFIARYQRVKPDIELTFINPDTAPEQARASTIEKDGEMLFGYQGRTEKVSSLDEQSIANTLQRLSVGGKPWIAFLEGHEERSPEGTTGHDLASFAAELRNKGYRPQPLSLASMPTIPDNTRLLVLASPRLDPLADEIGRIADYLDKGGNLLWLMEPEMPAGWQPLADHLGTTRLPGVVVDASTQSLGLDDPTYALVPRYEKHQLTQGLRAVTLFPRAAALATSPPQGWEALELLATLERSWTETGPLSGEIRQDPDRGERAGPLMIGLTLERALGEGRQRVAVIGDGDWLSNRFLGNGGNLDLGMRMIRWLTQDEALITVPARVAPDRTLTLGRNIQALIGLVTLFGLPGLMGAIGVFAWMRRRNG